MRSTIRAKFGGVALTALVIGLAAFGGDDGGETTAQDAANGKARSSAPDLDRFLMSNGEEPGFRRGAGPGQSPQSGGTITGVEAFVKEMRLADERQLRREGFISFA